ncbi:MAG: glyceraldehyde-3-phosphate dehydrogenase [Cognatishimia sp.]
MTNSIAVGLGVVVVLAVGADMIWLDGAAGLFLARKFALFVEWLAFWR